MRDIYHGMLLSFFLTLKTYLNTPLELKSDSVIYANYVNRFAHRKRRPNWEVLSVWHKSVQLIQPYVRVKVLSRAHTTSQSLLLPEDRDHLRRRAPAAL
jgi:hypothetical protein